jgi:hypothetical protein
MTRFTRSPVIIYIRFNRVIPKNSVACLLEDNLMMGTRVPTRKNRHLYPSLSIGRGTTVVDALGRFL